MGCESFKSADHIFRDRDVHDSKSYSRLLPFFSFACAYHTELIYMYICRSLVATWDGCDLLHLTMTISGSVLVQQIERSRFWKLILES